MTIPTNSATVHVQSIELGDHFIVAPAPSKGILDIHNELYGISKRNTASWPWRTVDMPLKQTDPLPTTDAATVPDDSSDDFHVPWLRLADFLLSPTPTANDIAVIEALARKEQEAIKRRIRRTAEQVKRQSKSKQ